MAKRGPKKGSRNAGMFKPGQSGNPGGAPKSAVSSVEIATMIRRSTNDCLDVIVTLVSILNDRSAKESDRIRAAETLLSYGAAKPPAAIEMTGKDGSPLVPVPMAPPMTPDEVRAALVRLSQSGIPAAPPPPSPANLEAPPDAARPS